jgi:hypothetical protein
MPLRLPSPRGGVLRIIVWIVSILLIVGVAAFVLADRFLRGKYEPAIGAMRKDATANIAFFCEQQTLLAKDPWFHEPRTEGDAGPLLNAWLPWEPQKEPPKGSPLKIPAQLPQTPGDFKDWLTSTVDVSSLDFGWMRQLHAHDRWDILQNAPTPLGQRVDWTNAPLPSYMPLMLWAKFRLLHGLRTGQPVEAARDVRHLAWLLYRTDTILGGAIATALLQFERQAYDSLPAPPPEWQPMSHEQLKRLRAVIMSSQVFSNIAAPVEVAKQARRCGEPAVTRCIALAESAGMAKLMKPYAEDSFREAYEAFAQDIAEISCPTSLPRMLWERGVTLEEQRLAGKPGDHPEWLETLPGSYARSHIAGILIAIATPNLKPLEDFRAELQSGSAQPAKP